MMVESYLTVSTLKQSPAPMLTYPTVRLTCPSLNLTAVTLPLNPPNPELIYVTSKNHNYLL